MLLPTQALALLNTIKGFKEAEIACTKELSKLIAEATGGKFGVCVEEPRDTFQLWFNRVSYTREEGLEMLKTIADDNEVELAWSNELGDAYRFKTGGISGLVLLPQNNEDYERMRRT